MTNTSNNSSSGIINCQANIATEKILFYLLLLFISICYTALRYTFNFEWEASSRQLLYDFVAAPPFGKRILTPLLSRPIVYWGMSLRNAFQFLEILSTFFLLNGFYHLFGRDVEDRYARIMSIGFVFALPLIFLLKTQNPWLFPWDTPAMAFVVWSVYLLFQQRWIPTMILLFFASLNRESAILIVPIFWAIYIDRLTLRKLATLTIAFLSIYWTANWLITLTLSDNLPFYERLHFNMSFIRNGNWRVVHNWLWLNNNAQNYLVLLSTMAGLPVAFIALLNYIPRYLKRFAIVSLLYFSMLAFVGNFVEPRIFGEICAILYIPFAFGCYNYCRSGGQAVLVPEIHQKPNCLAPIMNYLEFITVASTLAIAFVIYTVLKNNPPVSS